MFDSGYELLMWQIRTAWLREAEKNRPVRQVQGRQKRRFRLLSWTQAWLELHLPALRTGWLGTLRGEAKEAPVGSGMGGSLIP
jgi:hypothetical protein